MKCSRCRNMVASTIKVRGKGSLCPKCYRKVKAPPSVEEIRTKPVKL